MNNINVILNGRTISVEPRHHSYANLVHLAEMKSDRTYSCVYDRGPANAPEGSLRKGASVLLVEGMIINIADTSGA